MRADTGVEYDRWYPEVPAVMTVDLLADLLHTSDQVIRTWVRDGTIPAHRKSGGRKLFFLRHEIFAWLVENRYDPDPDNEA